MIYNILPASVVRRSASLRLTPAHAAPMGARMTDLIEQALRTRAEQVERALKNALPGGGEPLPGAMGRLGEAMRHGTLAGGKRLRPFLVIESAAALGADPEAAIPAACAVEMVHSYSLIHDDLPAMDDAETRRGEPSVHAAYGEAMGILAGDALLTDAFGLLAATYAPDLAAPLVARLAEGAGTQGMVGGQALDLFPEAETEAAIVAIQSRKTGALIVASALMGGVIGGASGAQATDLERYARALGLAFQIRDDVLDATSDAATMGKPVGRDEAAGKATFVGLYGLDGARRRIDELTAEAAEAAGRLPGGATLSGLAAWLGSRTS